MANPLYQKMKAAGNSAGTDNIFTRFMQFKQTFSGDPRTQIQEMLNSGKFSQQQYNQAVQMAQQFQQMLSSIGGMK